MGTLFFHEMGPQLANIICQAYPIWGATWYFSTGSRQNWLLLWTTWRPKEQPFDKFWLLSKELLACDEGERMSWMGISFKMNAEKNLYCLPFQQFCSVFWPLEKNCSDIASKNGRQRRSPNQLCQWHQGWSRQAAVQPVELPLAGREEAGHCEHAGGCLPRGDANKYSEYSLQG